MKPTQKQVIAWAREAGLPYVAETKEILGLNSAIRFATLAYEAGRKDENEACAKVCDELAANDKLSNYYRIAAKAIRARLGQ